MYSPFDEVKTCHFVTRVVSRRLQIPGGQTTSDLHEGSPRRAANRCWKTFARQSINGRLVPGVAPAPYEFTHAHHCLGEKNSVYDFSYKPKKTLEKTVLPLRRDDDF